MNEVADLVTEGNWISRTVSIDYMVVAGGGGGGSLNNIVEDTTPQLGGNLDAQAFDITTTGKILYSNMYAAEGDLPSATTYHGMFAHVHATGAGYFAHGGNWIKLANYTDLSPYQTVGTLGTNIDLHLNQSNPTSGYVLSWNGSDYAWISNAGYTNTDFDNRLATKDTGDLAEGSNLYFTNARADARITAALIDEDNMASNSATRLPSQQSVKAYVDAQDAANAGASLGLVIALS